MKPIDRSEVMTLGDYEQIRERFRARVLDEKRRRRALIGDCVSVLFENRDTVLLQIQEMLRTERITQEKAISHEIDTYNELVPGDGQLSFTLFIEVDEREKREQMLVECAGMERSVYLEVDGERVMASLTTRAGVSDARTTAVQYYLIDLPEETGHRIATGKANQIVLGIDHPRYPQRAVLAPEVVAQLRADLTWEA